jgi:DNA (cytosine-5)-methyltransferase 1
MGALRRTPSRPAEAIALGDPALLYLEMTRAAQHFGVTTPSTRRDRKSGATKRKQADIEAEHQARMAANA